MLHIEMRTKPPEVKIENGNLVGWFEFEQWAMMNDPVWYNAICANIPGITSHNNIIKFIAYHKTIEVQNLRKQLIDYISKVSTPLGDPR